jgi:glycosyltransferase involved in cell wall biosynthesis
MSAAPPFFSLLITSYNRPESVVACLESVLANEGEDFEVIIGDDASPCSEAIANAVRPYAERSKIRFHRHSVNIGEPANRNYLVAEATGRYNIILCDDDTLFPQALRTLRGYIERQPDQDLYLFGYRVVDETGVRCYDRVAPHSLAINLHHPRLVRRMFEATWMSFLLFHQSTFCCRRGIEREVRYRRELAPADDYMFLLECLNKGKRLYVLPECLMTYRWCLSRSGTHQVNQSSDIVRTMTASTRLYYALQERKDLHPLVAGIIAGPAYRRRFLYDVIIRRMPLSEESIALLRLPREHREEFEAYRLNVSRPALLLKIALQIMGELMRDFGFKGLLYWLQAWMAYVKYRPFNMPQPAAAITHLNSSSECP